MKKILLIGIPLLALLFASCSTSKITDSYTTQQGITTSSSKKILVLGLFSDKNRAAKRAMEEQLAVDLQKFGYNAVAATDEFGPTAFRGMNEKEALQKLQDKGIEHVVTITLIDKNNEKRYVPASPAYGYAPGFWGYYSYYSPWAYRPYYRPGYTQTTTKYVFETNLYDVINNQLLYSAQSQTVDASTMGALASDYARDIVKDMRKKNVLG
jgi:hypothetical protein